MRFLTYILFFFFSLSIVGKANLISFIKKIKSPVELSSATGSDDENRDADDDEKNERSEKEELKEKCSYYLGSVFSYGISTYYNCNKHTLNFYTLLFKSHFKEVVTPPPELV
jgi:hypothetical protein